MNTTKTYISDPRVTETREEIETKLAAIALENYPTLADFCTAHPIGQDFHTGLYGFERVEDCLNLNACKYAEFALSA